MCVLRKNENRKKKTTELRLTNKKIEVYIEIRNSDEQTKKFKNLYKM